MPLQNRVDPFGEIHAVAARGLFTGNRGVIHDPATKTLLERRWTTKAWIICECDFRGRRRELMGRNAPSGRAGWTELFFLDEVTALAAGHRPCFYCRRERAVEFARCFAAGQGRASISAPEMDAVLHRERWASGRGHRSLELTGVDRLPAGTTVTSGRNAFAISTSSWLKWSFGGWTDAEGPDLHTSPVLTPPGTIGALRHGYVPQWHASAR